MAALFLALVRRSAVALVIAIWLLAGSLRAQPEPTFSAPNRTGIFARVAPHFHEPAGSPTTDLIRDKPPYAGQDFNVGKPERVMPTGAGKLSAMVAYGDRVELALSTTEYYNAVSENGSGIPSGNHFNPLLSPGRLSIELSHASAKDIRTFDQWIDFSRGCVVIELETQDGKTHIEVGGDMEENNLVVSVRDDRSMPGAATVRYENWRDSINMRALAGSLVATESVDASTAAGAKAQSMSLALQVGCVGGETFSVSAERNGGAITIPADRAKDFAVIVAAKCSHGAPPLAAAESSFKKSVHASSAERDRQREKWWAGFWAPAWLDLTGPEAAYLSRLWYTTLYSYACVGQGPMLPKFNGGPGLVYKDTRSWGEGYWWQNQREISFWPMAGAGHPEFTRRSILFFNETFERSRDNAKRFALPGVLLGEGSKPSEWAVPFGVTALVEPPSGALTGETADPSVALARREATKPGYNALNFLGGLEFVQAIFDYVQYTGDREVAQKIGAPWLKGEAMMCFGLLSESPDGSLHVRSADAAEQWWKVDDPAPLLAGVQYVLAFVVRHGRALGLDASLITAAQQKLTHLAPLPTVETWSYKTEKPDYFWYCPSENVVAGDSLLAPFKISNGVMAHNSENPELYAVYPFALYDLNSDAPALSLAQRTFAHRFFKNTAGWSQCPVQAARLGLPSTLDVILDHAKKHQKWTYGGWSSPGGVLYANSGVSDCPYFDGAGVNLTALQESLLQSHAKVAESDLFEAGTIRLLPAVSQNWSGQFELQARGGLIVTVSFKDGQVTAARFEATRDAQLHLENPFSTAILWRSKGPQTTSAKIISLELKRGERLTIASGATKRN